MYNYGDVVKIKSCPDLGIPGTCMYKK